MIAANEIRIGNWVNNDKFKNPIQWTVKSFSYPENFEQSHPIPLTASILEKTGFHKQNNAYVPKNYDPNNYNHWYFTIWDNGDGTFNYNSAEFNVELKSLHQLQNLYYCLTREELQIKL